VRLAIAGIVSLCLPSLVAVSRGDDPPPAGAVAPDAKSDSAATPLSLDYQPFDSLLMIAARPHELFNREGLRLLDRLVNQIGGSLRGPIDMRHLEQLTFVQLPEDPERTTAREGTRLIFHLNIFRTREPVDWQAKLSEFNFEIKEERHGETVYYSLPDQPNVCIWLADERTFVAADPLSLKHAIDAHLADEKPIWADAMADVPRAAFAMAANSMYVNNELERRAEALRDQRLLVSAAKTLLKGASSIVFAAGESGGLELQGVLHYEDEKRAPKAAESVKGLMALVRSTREQLLGAQLRSIGGPPERAEKFKQMAQQLLDSAQIETRDRNVVVGMNAEMKLVQAVPAVVQTMAGVTGLGTMPTEELFATLEPKSAVHALLPTGVLNSPAIVARRTKSLERLKQVGLAMINYHDAHRSFPPSAIRDGDGKPLLSWRVALLPFLDQQALYDQFHLDEPWDSEHNKPLLSKMPELFAGPLPYSTDSGLTHSALYVVAAAGTCFPPAGAVSLPDVTDEIGRTILLVEAKRDAPWTKPEEIELDEEGIPLDRIGGWHPGGFLGVAVDGSASFFADRETDSILPHLFTIAAGDSTEPQPAPQAALELQPVQPTRVATAPAATVRAVPRQRQPSFNRLKMLAIAVHNYHEANRSLPPAAIRDKNGKPLLSWRVALLPYLEQDHLYKEFHLDEPWDSERNKKLLDKMPDVFAGAADPPKGSNASVFAVVGDKTCFPPKGTVGFRNVTDGTSNTIMFLEAKRDIPWTKPEEIEVDQRGHPKGKLGGWHEGGFTGVLMDGSARFWTDDEAKPILPALVTIAGGEDVEVHPD